MTPTPTKLLATLLLLAPMLGAQDSGPKTAGQQKQQCTLQIAYFDHTAGQPTPDGLRQADRCEAYARGIKDAMDGELVWLDDTHKRVSVGTWADGVTTDQVIRVFQKFAVENPALLNKPAVQVIRQSAEQAGIYTYATP
jgi:hypothetical protein